MTFQDRLNQITTVWRDRVGPVVANLVTVDIDALDGVRRQALREGASFPAMALHDHRDERVDLATVFAEGPAILTFYRGGWCQFCALALAEFQSLHNEARRLGVQVFAVSLEKPEFARRTVEENRLSFGVLHDREGRLADAVGIRYAVSDAARVMMGTNLGERHGDGAWRLPVPATYIVAKGGAIRYAHVDPDYRRRLSAEQITRALHRALADDHPDLSSTETA